MERGGIEAVVITHESASDVRAFLACETTRRAFSRIVFVDNASTDGTQELVLEAGHELVRLPANYGYGAAANIGARHTTSPLFAVLNPDVLLRSVDDTGRFAEAFADPRVGVLAPALMLPDGRYQDSVRYVPSPIDLVVRRLTQRRPDAIQAASPRDVPWAVGACLIVRREAFEAAGGFNERYFMYFEDVDLAVRLRRAGYAVRHDPTVTVSHCYAGASRTQWFGPLARHHARSALRFYGEHPRYLLPRRLVRVST